MSVVGLISAPLITIVWRRSQVDYPVLRSKTPFYYWVFTTISYTNLVSFTSPSFLISKGIETLVFCSGPVPACLHPLFFMRSPRLLELQSCYRFFLDLDDSAWRP